MRWHTLFSSLVAAGLSAFPVSSGAGDKPVKQPLVAWKRFQEAPADAKTLAGWDAMFSEQFIGVSCGKASGGLEVLDFDIPGKEKGQEPPAYKPWCKLLKEHGHEPLLRRLTLYTTMSGGRQIMYRCPEVSDGNQKLARHHKETLIETRGQGGYVVCPPTPGYRFLNGNFDTIPVLTLEERNILLEAARLFDEPDPADAVAYEPTGAKSAVDGVRPGDDYDARTTWEELLERLGWKRGRTWGDKTYWTRPGKSVRDGASAVSDTHLFVWSTNADLPTEKQLSKFAVYTHAYHRGDFGKAARQLAKEGYGQRSVPVGTATPSPALQAQINEIGTKKYNQTDAGNASRFLDMFGDRVRFCHNWGKWLVWDGSRWSMDEKGGAGVYDLALQMAYAISVEAADAEDNADRESLGSWALKCEARAKIENMLALAKTNLRVAVEPGELDSDPWLFNCANGTLHLKTGKLKPHDPTDLITRVCPFDYDPDAKFEKWERFLARILEDVDLQMYVYKALGYSLTGHVGEQVFFFAYGAKGANGKSTFMEVIQAILGGYSKAMQSETLMLQHNGRAGASPDIARLKGARFVSAPETPVGRRLDEQLVKQLTGGDTIVARYLYQDEFEFRPNLKLWMVGNHKPQIQGADQAIWRRVRLIPFNVVIPEDERNPNMTEELLQEASGILNWMVMGCLDWQEEGLKAPAKVMEAVSEYFDEMDVLGRFLEDRCELGVNHRTQSSTLYEAYRLWAVAEGQRVWTQTAFSLAMKERGVEKTKTMGIAIFLGVHLCGS